jgi:pilus assembly protein CpaC
MSKSMVIDLPADAVDVMVSDPKIADVVMRSSRRVFIMGLAMGQTNAFFFDARGDQILNLEIRVERDTGVVASTIAKFVPGAKIEVNVINDNIILSGSVNSLAESNRAYEIAKRFVDDPEKVLNLMAISGRDQVALKVRIVEMQRSVIKQLGVDLNGSAVLDDVLTGDLALSFANSLGFPLQSRFLAGFAGGGTFTNTGGGDIRSVQGLLRALERIGVVRTLAEPTVTAISGESAKFLAGGEFPVPVAQDETGTITVEFKPFGVGLGFTPVVLSEGRISLKISTEVSELSNQGAFQGEARQYTDPTTGEVQLLQGLTIPALTVRRTETTVELPSGKSLMLAGLIQEKTKQSLDQVPGVKDVPILGSLFRSRDYQNDETELVVIATPYLVDPTDPRRFRTPADGYQVADDAEGFLLGRLNEVYAVPGTKPEGWRLEGPAGFIID